jgi:hypothetical protein
MKRLATLTVLWFVVTGVVVYGQEKRPRSNPNEAHTENAEPQHSKPAPSAPTSTDGVSIANQQVSTAQEDRPKENTQSYFHRLISPENLPNIGLFVAGLIGIGIAICTLLEMRHQRNVMQGQLKAMQDQLTQMDASGKQTEKIIEQATKQANSVEGQLGLMKTAGSHTETLAAQAVRQSDITQRQLDLTNRPWICLDSVVPASDFIFKDTGEAVIFLGYQVRNVGHSAAQHLQPWIEPIISGIHDPKEVRDRISAQLKKPIDSAFDHGKLIFPSQVIVDTYPILIRKEIVDEALKNSPFKEQGDKQMPCFGLELFICFDYQSTLDPTIHHQTQSMFYVSRADPRGISMGTFFPSQRVYKAGEISIGYKGYGAYAD